MKKRTYASPVLAHLGDLYQLTLASCFHRVIETFNQTLSTPPNR